jgi:orotate phosphoribosyltransferase
MISKILIDLKAVHLRPNDFFTWSSGMKSPIYCDNRKIISAPQERQIIVQAFVDKIKKDYPTTNLIGATATAGIPWGAWVAHAMNLPLVYIRSSSKGHGLKNAIEGELPANAKALVIEDLFSTGGSSIKAANDLKAEGVDVLAIGAIFSYGLKKADDNFKAADFTYFSLDHLDNLLNYALEEKLLSHDEIGIIKEWKFNQDQ